MAKLTPEQLAAMGKAKVTPSIPSDPNTTKPSPEAKAETPEPEAEERKFQHYKSSRPSTRLITDTGIRIVFTKFGYMTDQQDVIDYLDREIAAGLNVIQKGELLTAKESDPMERLRQQHIAEYVAEQKQAKIDAIEGKQRDFGETTGVKLNVATSADVAN